MRILHLDAGKEMRGGQWQALRLIEGLASAGIESTLLAREGAPLFAAARKGGWRVEPLGLMRAREARAAARPDARARRAHPHAGRHRPRRAAGGRAARGVSDRHGSNRVEWKYGRARALHRGLGVRQERC